MSLTPQGKNMLDFEIVVCMYVQMETFGRAGREGGLPSLLIGGAGRAIRLHLAVKRAENGS